MSDTVAPANLETVFITTIRNCTYTLTADRTYRSFEDRLTDLSVKHWPLAAGCPNTETRRFSRMRRNKACVGAYGMGRIGQRRSRHPSLFCEYSVGYLPSANSNDTGLRVIVTKSWAVTVYCTLLI